MGEKDFAPLDFPTYFSIPSGAGGGHELVGRGGQASVYHVFDTRVNPQTQRMIGAIAVKCYPREMLFRDEKKCKYVIREILNHRRLCHRHVVGFREVRVTRNYLLIALDYVEGGSLMQMIRNRSGPLSEDTARWCFQQLILAVDYLHRRNVANRDISLENILINNKGGAHGEVSIVLCDFGLSRNKVSLERHGVRSFVGKKGYVAPEAFIKGPNTFEITAKGDIYACGVCLYKMLLGADAWPMVCGSNVDIASNANALLNLVCGSEDPKLGLERTNLSQACKTFLTRILHTNPKLRMTMEDIWTDSWFLTELPESEGRQYNDLTCSAGYIERCSASLQSEVELQHRVQQAADRDYQPDHVWA